MIMAEQKGHEEEKLKPFNVEFGGELGAVEKAAAEAGMASLEKKAKELSQQASEASAIFKEETKSWWRRGLARIFSARKDAPGEAAEPPAVQAVEEKSSAIAGEFKKEADEIVGESAAEKELQDAIDRGVAEHELEVSDGVPAYIEPEMASVGSEPEISDGVPVHIGPEEETAPKTADDGSVDIDVSDFDATKEVKKGPPPPPIPVKEAGIVSATSAKETAEEALARKEAAQGKMLARMKELEALLDFADDVASGKVRRSKLAAAQLKKIEKDELEEARAELENLREVAAKVQGQIESDIAARKPAAAPEKEVEESQPAAAAPDESKKAEAAEEKPLELGTIGEATGFDKEPPVELRTIAEATGFAAEPEPPVVTGARTADRAPAGRTPLAEKQAAPAEKPVPMETAEQAMALGLAKLRKRLMRDIPDIVEGGYDEDKARMLPSLLDDHRAARKAVEDIAAASPAAFLEGRLRSGTISKREYEILSKDEAAAAEFHRAGLETARERLKMLETFLDAVPVEDVDRAERADQIASKARGGHKRAFWKAWDDMKRREAQAAKRPGAGAASETKAPASMSDVERAAVRAEERAIAGSDAAPTATEEAPQAPEAPAGKSLFAKNAMKGIIEVMEGSGLAGTYKTLKVDKFKEALKSAGYDVPEGELAEAQIKKLLTAYKEAQARSSAAAARKRKG